jgi:hypothetical protein
MGSAPCRERGEPMSDRSTDRVLFRNGKAVLKVRDLPDGLKLIYKPFVIRDEHVMKITDAPGWDKEHIDAEFGPGVKGGLRYTRDIVQYDIDIEAFREHAFEKDMGTFGWQFHVHSKFYRTTGLVGPRRESSAPKADEPKLKLPPKILFGEWVPCTKCGTSGKAQKERCPKCQGLGFVNWSSAT